MTEDGKKIARVLLRGFKMIVKLLEELLEEK
jgi:hypothetical protein